MTDEQWELIEPLLPKPKQRRDKRGQPPASNRPCFEGILWILKTGAAWHFLPDEFPSPSTCWRRLQRWQEEGVWLELIAPYRKNNKERRYEDGHKLRRYKRRWIVERTNSWLGQFRRLPVRHDIYSPPIVPSSMSHASGLR